MTSPSRFLDAARRWATGRSWHWRALILAYLVYAAFRSLKDPDYGSIFSGVTLAFHEMGHVLFSPFGELLMIAGGSITQLAIPIIAALLLVWRQGDYFGFAVGGAWLGFSAMDLARYIADARALQLPLVSLGPEAEHDWWYLLSRMGWLRYDTRIAGLVQGIGTVILIFSILFATWLLWIMARGSAADDTDDPESRRFQEWLVERRR
ncbi:MAG: hypothetical protein GTO46_01900 [Gemmatimonadetes bacterium]|nr:hypothetical protein [Gemmatimonadota bacterium]NIO30550.1 hypothetical protein [Gemmatimonadota bacterium]